MNQYWSEPRKGNKCSWSKADSSPKCSINVVKLADSGLSSSFLIKEDEALVDEEE
eukprot:CAMPEP_0202441560 /NCGR_PEP_ID=MMETSP1360-20130828/1104_1 /ASSEMBLY_ACC=CAM_ASM_000848 /TAXON_ID=515479 /ORGANISM="Licmophora paradoxa, Strain CCMP2313" /LENGTH=54 /DNA_ID=CAMNT_0049056609 /DNA_START=219 /DNA_END=380 /DNA_ORIENTATION=+